MKLTNSDREAFIRAVLDDVPQVNYNEQCRTLVMAWAVARLPADVAAAYKSNPGFITLAYVQTPGCLSSHYAPGLDPIYNLDAVAPELWAQLTPLSYAAKEQEATNKALREQLKGAIFSCTTLKKAKEMLPEFEKYLPADRDGVSDRAMPMISNLVATLVEAGWPKSQGVTA